MKNCNIYTHRFLFFFLFILFCLNGLGVLEERWILQVIKLYINCERFGTAQGAYMISTIWTLDLDIQQD